jgi:hypothetical protein
MNAAGGLLASIGGASWIADWMCISLQLLGSGMPPGSSCLYFQGTTQIGGGSGVPFGDGLRCVGGSVVRLGTMVNDATGASRVPQSPGDPPLVTRGLIPIDGGTRYYQAWYRNAAAYCTASTFNLTNGLSVVWTW